MKGFPSGPCVHIHIYRHVCTRSKACIRPCVYIYTTHMYIHSVQGLCFWPRFCGNYLNPKPKYLNTGAFKGFASGLGAVGVALVVGAAIQAHILKSAF